MSFKGSTVHKHKHKGKKPNPESPESVRFRQQQWGINRKFEIRDYLFKLGKATFDKAINDIKYN